MEQLVVKKRTIRNTLVQLFINMITYLDTFILLLLGVGAFITTTYYVAKYNETSDLVAFQWDNVLINTLCIITLIAVFYFIFKFALKIKNKTLIVILCVLQLILGTIWIMYLKMPPQADQECLTYSAAQFIKGDFSWLDKGGYLSKYPYQLGMIFLIETLFRIFNTNSFLLPQMVNVVSVVACTYLIYKITNRLFKEEKITKILLLLSTAFIYFIFMTTHVYGNLIGLAFSLFAILFTIEYLETKKIYHLAFIAIGISLAMIFKNNYMIFLVGIVITLLLDCMKKFKLSTLLGIICIVVISLSSGKLVIKMGEMRSGYSTKNRTVPMISFVYMGLNTNNENPGWYTADTIKILERNDFDSKRASKESVILLKCRISEMISQPKESLVYMGKKVLSTWSEPTYETIKLNKPRGKIEEVKEKIESDKVLLSFYEGKISKVLIKYFDTLQIIIYFSTAIYFILNKKNLDIKKILLPLIFIGGFTFHLFWETKAIYVLTFYFLLLPYAAASLKIFFEKIEGKLFGDISVRKKVTNK